MPKYNRRAEWVWRPRTLEPGATMEAKARAEANRYVYFRKGFELDGLVARATVDVSADGRYQLFVNGQRIGRGPARCSSDFQSYDTYDLAPYLRPGHNVVAALAHSYGRDFAWYELPRWEAGAAFGCGGFFLQGSVTGATGTEVPLDTGASWRCLLSPAWRQDAAAGWVGYAEEYDARLAPLGWEDVAFDDSGWDTAQVLRAPGTWGGNEVEPFPVMEPRDLPFLLEEMRLPAEVLQAGEVIEAPGSLEDAFSAETISPLERCILEGVETLLREGGEAVVRTAPGRSASLVLDFGRTQQGRVAFEVDGPAGAVVDFRYGERLREDGRVAVPPWSWNGETYVQTHRVILPAGPLAWEMFEFGGFRYVQMTFRNCAEPLRLRQVAVNFTSYPVGDRGRFECSDPQLGEIYRVSAYTLQCCMHDSYEDCPSREQRQWTNDQYVHLMANYGTFGDLHLARRLLVQVAESQQPDGQVMMCAPGDFATVRHFNMPEFTLHWIMSIPQYVRYSGDTKIIRELYPSVVKGLAWFERHLDEEELLDAVPGWLWVDWAEVDKRGQLTEINARFVGCLRIAAGFAERLGIAHDRDRYLALAGRVSEAVNRLLWDAERGVYVDSRRNDVRGRRVSQQSNAAAMFFGVAPRERWNSIFSVILDPDRLRLTNALGVYGTIPFDEEHDVVLAHGFYMHFLHAALAEADRHEEIAANIRLRWGAQLAAGATTWWEAWEPEPTHTLCHAFMCTPSFDLPTYVLGVRPLADGFAEFEVAPQPAGLSWARGVFPAAAGDIPAAWSLAEDGTFELSVEVPEGTRARLALPKLAGRPFRSVSLDGVEAAAAKLWVGPGAHRMVAASGE